jgi:hypothetical protein
VSDTRQVRATDSSIADAGEVDMAARELPDPGGAGELDELVERLRSLKVGVYDRGKAADTVSPPDCLGHASSS